MAKEGQRRKKLTQLIKDLALIETTKNNKVPASIGDYILGEYSLQQSSNVKDVPNDEATKFVIELEEFIKETYKTHQMKEESSSPKVNIKQCFMKSCDAYAMAKSNYLQVSLQMNTLMHEIIQLKEKYSQNLKGKSLTKQGELKILEKKLHCLKLQSFLKFYSENNAFDAHLQLKELLAERLKNLQSQCNNLLDLETKYNELKTNKTYTELLQVYKQLLKREMKIDYMIEN